MGCDASIDRNNIFGAEPPDSIPQVFQAHLTPKSKIIHRGIFSPDTSIYYYTLSNIDYTDFNIHTLDLKDRDPKPQLAFFNSSYDDHGMSYSADGNTIYFSSTRPTSRNDVAQTWHIWKTEKIKDGWSQASYVDIPNMRGMLCSHPTITQFGKLYFHASELDYSNMDIYETILLDSTFKEAKKVEITNKPKNGICTPFVDANGDYLIFAAIGNQLDLWITYSNGQGEWINSKPINKIINHHGQGNPYVTPDHKRLFYASGQHGKNNWNIKWINFLPYIY